MVDYIIGARHYNYEGKEKEWMEKQISRLEKDLALVKELKAQKKRSK